MSRLCLSVLSFTLRTVSPTYVVYAHGLQIKTSITFMSLQSASCTGVYGEVPDVSIICSVEIIWNVVHVHALLQANVLFILQNLGQVHIFHKRK